VKEIKKESAESQIQVTDRRFWVQDPPEDRESAPAGRRYPTVVEELKQRTELAEQRLREKLQQLEEENAAFRKRLEKEMSRRLEQEKLDLLRGFLEISDNLERALEATETTPNFEALREGVRLSLELFLDRMQTLGVEPIEVLDKPFDPNEAEAVGSVPVNDARLDQQVTEVVQRGFRCGDQVLRPAKVHVGRYEPPDR